MARPRRVYLTGFMGTGKSAVGRALARRLGLPFRDLDAAVERRAGLPAARIFAARGEAAFRRLESAALKRLNAGPPSVVALGGGALLSAVNRERVLASGILVRLTCARDVLWRRLKPELPRRPLLAGGRKAFLELLRRRRRHYADAAISVSTTRRGPAAAAALILKRLRAK